MTKNETTQLKPGEIIYFDDRDGILTVVKGYLDIFITCFKDGKIEKKQIPVGRCKLEDKIFCFDTQAENREKTSVSSKHLRTGNQRSLKYKLTGRVNTETALQFEKYKTGLGYFREIEKPLNKWLDLSLSVIKENDDKKKIKYLDSTEKSFDENQFISYHDFAWIKSISSIKTDNNTNQLLFPIEAKYLPISKNIVYMTTAQGEIETSDTCSVLNELGFAPIKLILRHFLNNLGNVYLLNMSVVKNKFYQHIENKKHDLASTYIQAKSIMEKENLFKDIIVIDDTSKLVAAISATGKQFGINIKKTDANLQQFDSYVDCIKYIGAENNFFVRQVKLENEWWQKDGLSFIGFDKETSEPLAIVIKNDKYYYFKAESRKLEKVCKENCKKIYDTGFTLHPVLDGNKVTIRHFMKLIFLGNHQNIFILFLAALLIALLGMFTPFATNKLISEGIVYSDIPIVFQLFLALVIVAVASFGFYLIKNIAILRIDVKSGIFLQSAIMDRLFKLPIQFFRKYSAGDMAVRALGIETIQKILTGVNINAFLGGIFSISSLIMMFYYSARLAIVGLVMFIFVLIVAVIISLKQLKYMKVSYDLFGEASGISYQIFNGLAKLKVMDRETLGFSKWGEIYSKYCTNSYLSKKLRRNDIITESFIHSAGQVTIFLLIGLLIKKKLNVAEFVAFLTAFGQFSASLKTFTAVISSIIIIKPVYNRMKPILNTSPEITTQAKIHTDFSGNIELHDITFRYNPDSPLILNCVNMLVEPGEFIAIVGPSGTGKSTLFRVILGLEKPEQGSIFCDGQDIASLNMREFRRSIGVVSQNAKIIPGNIYENITGGGQYSEEEAWIAAELAGLKDDIKCFPMQMKTIISEDAGTFSGGQKQRMVIARALIKKPKILLLDEATNALDNKTQSIITDNLNNMKITRVVIAHRLSTIKNADRIYVLKDAGFTEIGNYEELIAKKGFFYKMAKRQLI